MDPVSTRLMLEGVLEDAEILPGQDGGVYARVPLVDEEIERVAVTSAEFLDWVNLKFCSMTGHYPPASIRTEVIARCVVEHRGAGLGLPVGCRVCQSDSGTVYVDLADQTGRAIAVSAQGWEIVTNAEVIFPVNPHRLALPEPKAGSTINGIAEVFGLSPPDVTLIVGWLLACLRGSGPYPLLVITGPDASGKTTLARFIRDIVDPSILSLRTLPRGERDLATYARANFVLAFDNISSVRDSIAEVLVGTAKGTIFTGSRGDREEVFFQGQRPVILVGTGEFIRPELIRHSIIIRLAERPARDRKNQRDMARQFQEIQPLIFGALLDAIVKGMGRLERAGAGPANELSTPEFEEFVNACEPGLLDEGAFAAAYDATVRPLRRTLSS